MAKKTKLYVIYALYEGEKKYVVMDFTSGVTTTNNIAESTVLPNKVMYEIVVRALTPVVQKAYPGMTFGYEVIQ